MPAGRSAAPRLGSDQLGHARKGQLGHVHRAGVRAARGGGREDRGDGGGRGGHGEGAADAVGDGVRAAKRRGACRSHAAVGGR